LLGKERMCAAIQAHCDTLSARDKDGWLALWSEDAILEDPVGTPPFEGKDALRTRFWKMIEAITPMHLWLEREPVICGDNAIAVLWGVVSPGGRLSRVGPIYDHFRFDEAGKFVSMRAFWTYDPAHLPSFMTPEAAGQHE